MLMLLDMSNKKIYHKNEANKSLSLMTLPARRLLYLTIAKIVKDKNELKFDPNQRFIVTAKEYAELCNVSHSVAYRQLKEGIWDIRTTMMEVLESEVIPADKRKNRPADMTIVFTVANYGAYSNGEGFVELSLDPIIAPYISNLKADFTSQYLLSALRLADSNANKLYLLLCEWVSSGMYAHKIINIDELKIKLSIETIPTYEEFKAFRNLFFKRAVKIVLEQTEFSKIEMEIIERIGRKASKVKISYEYDDQLNHLKDHLSNKKSKNNGELVNVNGRYMTKSEAIASGYNV